MEENAIKMQRQRLADLPVVRFVRGKFSALSDGRGVAAGAISSVAVRAASAMTTLVAMPIALHTLGEYRFGVFLLLFGVINWITLGNFGVQSALARAIASKEIGQEQAPYMLGAALVYAAVTTVFTALLVSGGFIAWRFTVGTHLPVSLHEVTLAAGTMIVLMTAQIILQSFEGIRIGNLKTYALNFTRLAGSMFSFIGLIVLPKFWPSMVVFVIALNGGQLLGAILNAASVMRVVRPRFGRVAEDLHQLRRLATSGFAYFTIGVASLFQTHFPVLILASVLTPVAGIDYGLFVRLVFVLMNGLTMITAPLWPALLNARVSADRRWIEKSLQVAALLVIGTGFSFFVAIAFFGGHVIHLWTGRSLAEPVMFKYLFGIYFFQMAWSHYWATLLMGFGRERIVSVIIITEGVIMMIAGTLLSFRFGPTGMILGQVATFALVTNWILPFLASRELKQTVAGWFWLGRTPAAHDAP